jgi:hypothetical protein
MRSLIKLAAFSGIFLLSPVIQPVEARIQSDKTDWEELFPPDDQEFACGCFPSYSLSTTRPGGASVVMIGSDCSPLVGGGGSGCADGGGCQVLSANAWQGPTAAGTGADIWDYVPAENPFQAACGGGQSVGFKPRLQPAGTGIWGTLKLSCSSCIVDFGG